MIAEVSHRPKRSKGEIPLETAMESDPTVIGRRGTNLDEWLQYMSTANHHKTTHSAWTSLPQAECGHVQEEFKSWRKGQQECKPMQT